MVSRGGRLPFLLGKFDPELAGFNCGLRRRFSGVLALPPDEPHEFSGGRLGSGILQAHGGPTEYSVGEDEDVFISSDMTIARLIDLRTYSEEERAKFPLWYGPGPAPTEKSKPSYGYFNRKGYTVQHSVWKLMNLQARLLIPLSALARQELVGPIPSRLWTPAMAGTGSTSSTDI